VQKSITLGGYRTHSLPMIFQAKHA